MMEDRVQEAQREFDAALRILAKHPCPTIEWKILKAGADLAKPVKDSDAADELRARVGAVVRSLADSVSDENLRQGFVKSRAVGELQD